jgi:hypothetical protein
MALHATPSGPSEAARNRIVQLSGSGQDTHSETDPCLVCGRPATGGLNARTAARATRHRLLASAHQNWRDALTKDRADLPRCISPATQRVTGEP